MFESSVNLYGGKTYSQKMIKWLQFESSVNLYGGKTMCGISLSFL